jgi:DNA-binding MarR family transcriptional regulator
LLKIVTRRPHAVHGRIQLLEITDTGRKLMTKCRNRVNSVESQLSAYVAPEEEAVIRRWLPKAAPPR